ncbi:unnamed protein product, partial [marine sediment metagenome]
GDEIEIVRDEDHGHASLPHARQTIQTPTGEGLVTDR